MRDNDEPYIPDLSGISIMISTPSHDGKYEGRFMRALHKTAVEIRRLGGECDFVEFSYCADISLARAKIFGMFHRSKHTHLMMIDSDMGWLPEDVVRLVLLDRDFIAAAGPKKQDVPKFACNFTDDFGHPLPLVEEIQTGVVRVSEVGLAFALIKRPVADKLIEAHPELQFDGDGKDTEYSLFDPIIINRRRLSEDYSFCRRWVQLGGKIELLSTVRLTHTGTKTWVGALCDIFNQPGWSINEEVEHARV